MLLEPDTFSAYAENEQWADHPFILRESFGIRPGFTCTASDVMEHSIVNSVIGIVNKLHGSSQVYGNTSTYECCIQATPSCRITTVT